MYGIRQLTVRGLIPGYIVKLGRRRVNYTKWFGFDLHGGQGEALAAAQAWRNEQIKLLELLTKQEFVSQVRRNNTSGVAGVLRVTSRWKKRSGGVVSREYWLARPPRGIKANQCGFSIKTHGEEVAKALAIQARKAMEALCTGFHAPHVPSVFIPEAADGTTESKSAKDR